MNDRQRIALLIDADGMSMEVIAGAIELVKTRHGAIHVRRCYCSAEFATKNLGFLKENGIRAMVNATSGKNCTDIALAIDAVELCGAEPPTVVVIVASDSDFAPLVIRLRERGCRVEGIGQAGKTGVETPRVYDDFVDLPQARRSAARAAPRAPARPAAKAAVRAAAAPPAPTAAPLPEGLAAILEAIPDLAAGRKVELNVAAEALRKAGLLSKSGSSTKLFRNHPDELVLMPARQPNSVQLRGRAA
jgi:uncharacterized protein (TIGR00288 family)|nr:NYN domain-containing protein [Caldimonas sp.]